MFKLNFQTQTCYLSVRICFMVSVPKFIITLFYSPFCLISSPHFTASSIINYLYYMSAAHNGTACFKKCKQLFLIPAFTFCLETSVGQSYNLYLNVAHSTTVLIRHLWQLKTVVFLHWCLIYPVPLYLHKLCVLCFN